MKPQRHISTLIGNRYGRLVITGLGKRKGNNQYYKVMCDCGNTKESQLGHLEHGSTLSCGCLRIENVLAKNKLRPANFKHGLNKHPLFKIWNNMMSRCYRKGDTNYPNYGADGVTVCEEWRNSNLAFYNWAMANGWKIGLQLDKDKLSPLKTGKIYSPEFCCFLTRKENMQYRRNSVMIKYKKSSKNIFQWSELLGIPDRIIRSRYKSGWTAKDIFEKPIRILVNNKYIQKQIA